MKCPSCQNEMSMDPMDPTKSVCYVCRKRYSTEKVAQYWEETARLASNRTQVGAEVHAEKKAQKQMAANPGYGNPYVPQMPQSPQQPSYPTQQQPYPPTMPQHPVYQQPVVQPYAQPQPQQPAAAQQAGAYQQPVVVPYAAPMGYPPVYPMMNDPVSKKIKGLSIASLSCSLASIFLSVSVLLGFLLSGTGLGLGIASLVISSKNARKKSGMAIAGVIIGAIMVLLALLAVVARYSLTGLY